MYDATCRAHWLELELAFNGWRKVSEAARAAKPQCNQDALPLQRKNTGAAALIVLCEDDEPAIGMPATPAPKPAGGNVLSVLPSRTPAAATAGAGATACSAPASGSQAADLEAQNTASPSYSTEPAADASAASPDSSAGIQASPPEQLLQEQQDQPQQDPPVLVSLADFPSRVPWRPLAWRSDVMARQGLQRLSGAHLAKAVRDLRELEGVFIIKDHEG